MKEEKDPINYDNYVGYKVKLDPTEEQKSLFNSYFNLSRFVYNLGIDIEKEIKSNHLLGNSDISFLDKEDLAKHVVQLKKNEEYKWLKEYDSTTIKLVLFDVVKAYTNFFKYPDRYNKPKYKAKKKAKKQFPTRAERMTVYEDEIFINNKIGTVKFSNSYGNSIIGSGNKDKLNTKHLHYVNPRISFNGLDYYLSFSLPKDQEHNINSYQYYGGDTEWQEQESSETIGIDVGLRREKWIKDSRGNTIIRPDNSKEHKKLKHLYKKLDRQYETNSRKSRLFSIKHPDGSRNMQKVKAKINKYHKKIVNRRKNIVNEYCKTLLKLKPEKVIMETISVSEINATEQNTKISKQKRRKNELIKEAALYDSMNMIERKLKSNGIPVIFADPNYPSSQLCSCCGYKQKIGTNKFYRCPNCGTVIDADLNAAINLANYETYLKLL